MLWAMGDVYWNGTLRSGPRLQVHHWRLSSFAFESLMTSNAAIHCTLVVPATVVVSLS